MNTTMTLTGIANLAFIILLFSPGCKNYGNIPHLKALDIIADILKYFTIIIDLIITSLT